MDLVFLSIAIFLVCCCLDTLYIAWYYNSDKDRAITSGILSILIQVVGLYGLILTVNNQYLIIPNAIGHGVGSYLGVKLKKRRKAINEKKRNERCPVHGDIA
jgi:uncharacterized protein YebE (UPF0316 family)